MTTIHQLFFNKNYRTKKIHKSKSPALRKCPQKKAIVVNVVIRKPKKPNSARRHIANIRLSTGKRVRASIPGEHKKDQGLKQYSKVLVRGGRIRDIIGVRYKIILGKFDAKPFYDRSKSRSKYGVKRSLF